MLKPVCNAVSKLVLVGVTICEWRLDRSDQGGTVSRHRGVIATAQEGSTGCVWELLQAGADVDLQNKCAAPLRCTWSATRTVGCT